MERLQVGPGATLSYARRTVAIKSIPEGIFLRRPATLSEVGVKRRAAVKAAMPLDFKVDENLPGEIAQLLSEALWLRGKL